MSKRWDRPFPAPSARYGGGFSYTEVLIATALVAVALVPMFDGLRIGLKGGEIQQTEVEQHYRVLGRLEEILAEPFEALDAAALAAGDQTTPTLYSDAPATKRRRLVYIARYDGDDADGDSDPFTGGDDGLLWLRVEIEHTAQYLDTLTTR